MYLSSDICDIITNYIYEKEFILLDWIDINKLDWDVISITSYSIKLLKEYQYKINWKYLSLNKNGIELLKNIKIKLIGMNYLEIQME